MKAKEIAKSTSGFNLHFDSEDEIMHIKFDGIMSLKELVDGFSAVLRHKDFFYNMPACYDFSNAIVEIDINETEVIYHFAFGLMDKRGREYQLAFVYADGLAEAMINFYRLFFSRTLIDVEMFRNKLTAVEWIKESRKSATISYLNSD